MTLTPSTVRLDLKCGKGAISQGEKCRKGPAKTASFAENLLKYGGAAGAVGSIVYATRRGANVFGATSALNTSIGAVASGVAMEGARTKNRSKQLLATSVAASNFGAAAFNAYAAHLTGSFNRQYKSAADTFSRGQQETNESFNNAWRNVGGKQRPGASSYSRNKQGTRRNIAVTDPFKDIGVPESAPDSQVKAAWLKLMRQHHPDVGGDPRKAQQINAAYQEIQRRRRKLDSVYADGFNIDLEALSL